MNNNPSRVLPILFGIVALIVSFYTVMAYSRKKGEVSALAEISKMILSDDKNVRIAAINSATTHFMSDELPQDVYAKLVYNARASLDYDVNQAIIQGVWLVSQEKGHTKILKKELENSRPYLEIRYAKGTEQNLLDKLKGYVAGVALTKGPIIIVLREFENIQKAELRCFDENCEKRGELSDQINSLLGDKNISIEVTNKKSILALPLLLTNTFELYVTPASLNALKVSTHSAENLTIQKPAIPSRKK